MQYSEFEGQIERLRGVYSSGSLNPERIRVWWDRFKGERVGIFESALNHVIAEATTQALPAMSRIVEACGMFRTNPGGATWMKELQPAHACEKCRDFGFSFSGHTVVACGCSSGVAVNPERLAHAQKSYDRGRKIFRSPFDAGQPPPSGERIFAPLPYNPNDRLADKSGEWA